MRKTELEKFKQINKFENGHFQTVFDQIFGPDFWRCLRLVRGVFRRYLGGVWEVFERCLGGFREVFGGAKIEKIKSEIPINPY